MNLQDLSVLLAAVELAVKRGTYSILEVGVVGEAATKLNAFLAEAKRQQDEAAAAQAQAEAGEQPPAPAPAPGPAEPQPEQPAQ